MIIDYDHSPSASYERKLQSLKESVQMALNEVGSGSTTIIYQRGSGGGGETEYDFTTSLTPSIDSRGVSAKIFIITPTDSSKITAANAAKLEAYLVSGTIIYPLLVTHVTITSGTYFLTYLKSLEGSPQNTTSTTVSGTLHIVAPFEISNVTASM